MENWNDGSKKLSETMGVIAKRAGEIGSEITNVMNNFVKSEEFRRFEEIISNIPDDVQKTEFFQNCKKMRKVNLTYEEVKLLFDEFEIFNIEKAKEVIYRYIDGNSVIHNYIKSIMENNCLENREKLVIILCHFERLLYSTLRREKKRREKVGTMLKSELITSNHGMESENIYKTVLFAIKNVVFANTDEFTKIDKRLPFRNNILHRGIIDYSDEDVNIAYETLLIFIAHVIDMNESLFSES